MTISCVVKRRLSLRAEGKVTWTLDGECEGYSAEREEAKKVAPRSVCKSSYQEKYVLLPRSTAVATCC